MAAGRSVLAMGVHEDTAVASPVLARRPGLVAPLELHHKVIVFILLFSHQSSVDLAGDVHHAVVDGEDLFRVVVLAVGRRPEPGVEIRQVLAVEKVDDALAAVSRYSRQSEHKGSTQEHNRDNDAELVHG